MERVTYVDLGRSHDRGIFIAFLAYTYFVASTRDPVLSIGIMNKVRSSILYYMRQGTVLNEETRAGSPNKA